MLTSESCFTAFLKLLKSGAKIMSEATVLAYAWADRWGTLVFEGVLADGFFIGILTLAALAPRAVVLARFVDSVDLVAFTFIAFMAFVFWPSWSFFAGTFFEAFIDDFAFRVFVVFVFIATFSTASAKLTNRGNIKKMCAAWISLSQSWHHGSCVAKVPSHVAPPYGLQGMMIVTLYWDFTNKNMGIQWMAGFMGSGKTCAMAWPWSLNHSPYISMVVWPNRTSWAMKHTQTLPHLVIGILSW